MKNNSCLKQDDHKEAFFFQSALNKDSQTNFEKKKKFTVFIY